MFAVGLSILLSVLDYAVANVALPSIAADIHTTTSNSIWVINAYQLANVIALLPLASLGERIGYARMCRIGLVVFVVASLACALATNLPVLAAARAFQGLGGSCIMSVNAALLRFIYPSRMLGKGIALNAMIIALGTALGPTVASAVLSVANWPWLFLINLPLGGAALAFASTSLPVTPRTNKPFDAQSAGLNALAFGALIVGGDRVAHGSDAIATVVIFLVGVISLALLVRRQLGTTDPLFPIDLLALPEFRVAVLVGFLSFIGSNLFIISMPFMLQEGFHRTAVATGLLITPWPLAIVLVAPLVGRLSDRYSAGVLSSMGMLVNAIGFLLLTLLPPDPSNLDIIWRIVLAGAGFGFLQPPNNRAMLLAAPRTRAGGASGMISMTRLLGQTVGAMSVALIFGFIGSGATRTCLGLAAMAAVIAALMSASRLLRKPRAPAAT
ncbi:MFS transporter [Acidisphaera sp. L21]|uniref:MFS transporter n=1 Tax=Acidisphaera sp. L21 TaxID=1641851 RepID=UPI00131C615C|nr:MFS transporter [Acidisphaera sp. L21]